MPKMEDSRAAASSLQTASWWLISSPALYLNHVTEPQAGVFG